MLRPKKQGNSLLQLGHNLVFEPWIPTQPEVISWAGVRHWDYLWPILLPMLNIGRYGLTTVRQMPGVRILPDNKSQTYVWQMIQQ